MLATKSSLLWCRGSWSLHNIPSSTISISSFSTQKPTSYAQLAGRRSPCYPLQAPTSCEDEEQSIMRNQGHIDDSPQWRRGYVAIPPIYYPKPVRGFYGSYTPSHRQGRGVLTTKSDDRRLRVVYRWNSCMSFLHCALGKIERYHITLARSHSLDGLWRPYLQQAMP